MLRQSALKRLFCNNLLASKRCISNAGQHQCITSRAFSQRALDKTTKSLLRTFDSEIKLQEKLIKESMANAVSAPNTKQQRVVEDGEEDDAEYVDQEGAALSTPMDVDRVMEMNKEFLEDEGWSVRDVPGSAAVEMSRTEGDVKTVIRFDVQQVVSGESDAELGYDKDDVADGQSYEEDADSEDAGHMTGSFPLVVEIHRPNADGKHMLIECIAELEGSTDGALSVENVSLVSFSTPPANSLSGPLVPEVLAYEGPEFHTLDDQLRQQIDDFVNTRLDSPRLVPFVSGLSQAKESREYLHWLQRVRSIFASN